MSRIDEINLYPEMNKKISDLFAMSTEPMYLYAAKYIRQLEAELAGYREAKRDDCCDNCRFKLHSEAWKYYTYSCNECRRRTKDHFEAAEAALQKERENNDVR